jgi:uncharacterized protein
LRPSAEKSFFNTITSRTIYASHQKLAVTLSEGPAQFKQIIVRFVRYLQADLPGIIHLTQPALCLYKAAMHHFWPVMLRRSAWTIWLTLCLTLVFVFHIRNLQFDTSPSTLILPDSAETAYYERISRIFGNDQVILIGIRGENLLSGPELSRIRELSADLERISGVKRVVSLTNAIDVRGAGDEVVVSPLIPADLRDFEPGSLRERLVGNPFFEKNLISSDRRSMAILVFLEDFDPAQSLTRGREVTRQVRAMAHARFGVERLFISGLPEMELQGTTNMMRDLHFFTPLTVLLVTGILLASFRCLRGVVLPLTMIALTLLWTIATMIWTGRPLKVTTMILPSLLIANGSSYAIHFLAQYYRVLTKAYLGRSLSPVAQLDRESYRTALLEALTHTHAPMFISAATTMAGFGSLIFTSIPAIRDLGIFATLGIFLSYLFCVTLVPSILWYLPIPRYHQLPGKEGSHRHGFLERLGDFNIHYRKWIYAVSIAGGLWGIWGLFHLTVHTDYLRYFPASAPVVQAASEFHERLAGIAPLSIVVESTGERKVTEPDILHAVEALQRFTADSPTVDATLSLVDTLKLLNRAFHSEAQQEFRIPNEPEVIDELVEFAESDPSGLCGDFLSSDHRALRILARTHLFSSSELGEEIDRVERHAAQLFPASFRVQVTGSLVLMNQTSDRVSTEQAKSLALSTALIAVIVIFLFHSWKVGLLSLLPAGFPILLFFGLMGWTGIFLNVNTSVIASIAIGIAIDNCVHYLVHFQRSFHRGLSIAEASRQSLMDSGGPMVAAAIALGLGFLVFALSRFEPVAQFGLLSAFIMGVNLLADIFLLPALMLLLGSSTLERLHIEEG